MKEEGRVRVRSRRGVVGREGSSRGKERERRGEKEVSCIASLFFQRVASLPPNRNTHNLQR